MTSTSSYPYVSEGPVDFANTNFVNVCQKDYYYAASSSQVIAEVTQCNDTFGTFWTLLAIATIFVALTVTIAWLFARKFKHT